MKWCALLLMLTNLAVAQVPRSKHVWIITEENHSFEEVIGNPSMPYYNSLAARYGLATEYYSNQHNSLSALMWLVAGQAVTSDDDAASSFNVNNIVRGVLSLGLKWKSYQVDLPYAGFQGLSSGNYVRRHNPLIDFTDSYSGVQSLNSVPITQLTTDIKNNATPNFAYISPNLDEDAHDGTLPEADEWLEQNLPAILGRPEFAPGGDGLLFVVWDEGNLNNDNRCSGRLDSGCGGRVATMVIGPQVRPHYQSATRYDHTNLLRTVCDALGVTSCPGEAALAIPMADFFNTVNISNPLPNAAVASPVHIQAGTNDSSPVTSIQVYVDDSLKYQVAGSKIDASILMNPGQHHLVLQSWDAAGGIHKSELTINVQPQAVVVNTPSPQAIVASPVPIRATAGGNHLVHTMQVYVDDILSYQANANSLNANLPMSGGSHHVVVQAWDDSGGITKSGNYVTVTNPYIAIFSPTVATTYSPVQINAWAQDPNPVFAVQAYVDNTLSYEFSGTGLQVPLAIPPGTHSLTIQAWDAVRGIYKQKQTVNIKPVPVTISLPVNNANVTSQVRINAWVPSDSPVYLMQVYVDGALQYQTSGTSVNTVLAMNTGRHSVVVQAWDNGGSTWKSSVQVSVVE
ncbi:MAG: alkaline phosphatase family protein [Terriglobales bacterium]